MTMSAGRWEVVKRVIFLACLWAMLAACATAPTPTLTVPSQVPLVYVPTATATSMSPPTSTPSPSPEPTAFVCDEPGGRLIETTYPGAVLHQEIPVTVYLPPCYDRVTEVYPSVILLHGNPITVSNWPDLGVVEAVDEGIRQGFWRPFIMVMPVEPEPLFTHTDGGDGSYEVELTQGLLPYIEATFRTRRDAQARAIAGISRGGVWALEIGFRHPELFRAVVALSPALALNDARPAYDPLDLAQTESANLPPWIFLGAGDVDWARTKTMALADALNNHGGSAEVLIIPGDHLSATWKALMPAVFRYLTAVWRSSAP
jgi:enterochelin esterase-like enzyme